MFIDILINLLSHLSVLDKVFLKIYNSHYKENNKSKSWGIVSPYLKTSLTIIKREKNRLSLHPIRIISGLKIRI